MKRKIPVFIASPGDLSRERKAFRDAVRQLNVGFGDGADVEFEALGWEDTLASIGRRSQSVINAEIDSCEIFILALFRRWGQDAPDAMPYSSYTEEEFYRALNRWTKTRAPEIFVFFKRVDPESEADAGPQLLKVMEFRKKLEDTRQVIYRYFTNEDSFIAEIDRHLRAYVKGALTASEAVVDVIILPATTLNQIAKAKRTAQRAAKEAEDSKDSVRASLLHTNVQQLQMVQEAADLSRDGKFEFARQKFSELVVNTVDPNVLDLGYEFFYRTGDLESAQSVLEKRLSLTEKSGDLTEKSGNLTATAASYCNLASLYYIGSDFEIAEEMYRKSLDCYKKLGNKEGMATQYGNLGNLYYTKKNFERAEEMYRKSLLICSKLDYKEGMARSYCDLGNLYYALNDLKQAEEMYQKSLDIKDYNGRDAGLARSYGDLGNLYFKRGEHARSEELYNSSLAAYEQLNNKEGMEAAYHNLGHLHKAKSNYRCAEEMYEKSLAINSSLGRKVGMACSYSDLGDLYKSQGKLERAEEMYRKALAIYESLGRKEGIADQYDNLGLLYKIRSEPKLAEEMYKKSLALNEMLGRKVDK